MSKGAPSSGIELTEAEVQRLLYEYDYLQRLAQLIRARLDTLNMLRTNLTNAREALNALKDKNEGHELLIPIGGGVYIYGSLENAKSVLVDLGAGYVIERSFDTAIEYINTRLNEIDKSMKDLVNQLNQVTGKLSEIEPILRKYLSERRGTR
ncbi:MAG: prefoldin subunit alpha [Thermoprotei archaeon]|nr:prefoldin subunit alpha [Thermoprotei archaeon]